jgi:hypothetical protein
VLSKGDGPLIENESFSDNKFRDILSKNITAKISSVGKELIEFRSNFQQSAQTIIDNVSLILNSVEDEVVEDFRRELSEFEAGIRGKLEPELRGRLETEIAEKVESEQENRITAARQEGAIIAEEKLRSKLATLDETLKEISRKSIQVDILTCFLDKAALFAPRVAFFVIKSGNIVGWQARGFEGDFNNDSIKSLVFPPGNDNLLRQVYDSKVALKGNTASNPAIHEIVSKFGPLAPDSICAIPLVVRDKTVAILYADSGLIPNYSLDSSILEIIATVVGLAVELGSARAKLGIKPSEGVEASLKPESGKEARAAEKITAEPHVPPERPSPPVSATPATVQDRVAQAAKETHEEVHAPELAQSFEAAPASPGSYQDLSVFPASAPDEIHRPIEPIVQPSPLPYSPPVLGDVGEAEQKLHNDARRFARLLVSEIKLYNEQKVQAGRRDKNLYDLLRDDIDKSREMYEKRISPNVAAKADYFYDEMVRILADNHADALGKECPGPVLAR